MICKEEFDNSECIKNVMLPAINCDNRGYIVNDMHYVNVDICDRCDDKLHRLVKDKFADIVNVVKGKDDSGRLSIEKKF